MSTKTKIAVEIKSFISPSPIRDFRTALGQFLNYRIMLEAKEPELCRYRGLGLVPQPVDVERNAFLKKVQEWLNLPERETRFAEVVEQQKSRLLRF